MAHEVLLDHSNHYELFKYNSYWSIPAQDLAIKNMWGLSSQPDSHREPPAYKQCGFLKAINDLKHLKNFLLNG